MKAVSLSGSPRENVGKKDAKKLRKEGLVPCVIYGGQEQLFFYVQEKELLKIIISPEVYAIELDIKGKKKQAIIQDVQFHPVKDTPIHVDFLEISEEKPIVVSLPILISGSSPGVLRGGKLQKKLRRLTVKGLLKNIPDNVTLDISTLDIGDSIRVKDIAVEGLTFMDMASSVVIGIQTTRASAAATGTSEEA